MAAERERSTEVVLADSVLGVGAVVLRPFVAVDLWRWFVAPFGMREITWSIAFGLLMLLGLVTYRYKPDLPADEKLPATVQVFVAALVAWGCGYLAHRLGQ